MSRSGDPASRAENPASRAINPVSRAVNPVSRDSDAASLDFEPVSRWAKNPIRDPRSEAKTQLYKYQISDSLDLSLDLWGWLGVYPHFYKWALNMPYLRAGPDSVELNSNHTYYDQIQGQLHFTGLYIQIVE